MPEGLENGLPLRPATAYLVELVLESGRIVIGDIAVEEALEKAGQEAPALFCKEAVLFDPHIGPVLERLDDRGVGRWAADAQFFHLLDQTGFAVARWWLGEMLDGIDGLLGRAVALGHGRQQASVIVLVVIAAFLVERQKAGELHNLAIGTQTRLSSPVEHLHRGAFEPGGRHLAGHGPFQDEIVELRMVAGADGGLGEACGPDRFMRFLGILGLGLVDARAVRDIAGIIAVGDCLACSRNGAAIHLHTIGPHIGDRTIFIKLLGDPHGVAGGIAELARGFLLQGRGREGWRRIAGQRLGFDHFDGEQPVFYRRFGQHRLFFVDQVHFAELFAVMDGETGFERLTALLHLRRDRPIFLGLERLDFAFPFNDQPERYRLDAASGFCAGQLAPENRRQRKANQIVESPASAIGVDQIFVERARMRHRVGHRGLGDRVEGHPVDLVREGLLITQNFQHMPADRFSFTVRVGRKDQASGLFRFVADRLELLRLVRIVLPGHGKTVIRVDRSILWRKVADMSVGRQHLEIRSQIFLDGLGFGGRLDDN